MTAANGDIHWSRTAAYAVFESVLTAPREGVRRKKVESSTFCDKSEGFLYP